NIVAYLPFLLMHGNVGRFVYSLPVVLTCSLVASRLVSMTFIPLLGYTLLRPSKASRGADGRMMAAYRKLVGLAIDHRYKTLLLSLVVLAGGVFGGMRLKSSFFPKDLSYISYVDLYLPEDASISATTEAAMAADRIIREVAAKYGEDQKRSEGVLRSV